MPLFALDFFTSGLGLAFTALDCGLVRLGVDGYFFRAALSVEILRRFMLGCALLVGVDTPSTESLFVI